MSKIKTLTLSIIFVLSLFCFSFNFNLNSKQEVFADSENIILNVEKVSYDGIKIEEQTTLKN